jgi:AbiV family abortive infection protein
MVLGALTARQGLRGPAVSLLVLALEESVKARALMAKIRVTQNPEARLVFDDEFLLDVIHSSHKRRHVLALLQGVSDETRGYLLALEDRATTPNARDIDYGEWLQRANGLKMRGLYVDFKGGQWESPEHVTGDDLRQTTYYVFHFVEETVKQARNHLAPGEVLPAIKLTVRDDENSEPTVAFGPPE